MAELVMKNAKVLFGGYDLSGKTNRVQMELRVEAVDRTCFGSSGRKRLAGLKDYSLTVNGLWDASTGRLGTTKSQGGGPDPVANTIMGSSGVVAIVPDSSAPASIAYFGKVLNSAYTVSGSVGDALGFTLAAVGDGRPFRGQIACFNQALSSAMSTNVLTMVARSTVQGVLGASVHLLASSGGIMTISVRGSSASNFGTETTMLKWTDLDGATGAGSARFAATKIPSSKMSYYKVRVKQSSGQITGSVFIGDGVK